MNRYLAMSDLSPLPLKVGTGTPRTMPYGSDSSFHIARTSSNRQVMPRRPRWHDAACHACIRGWRELA